METQNHIDMSRQQQMLLTAVSIKMRDGASALLALLTDDALVDGTGSFGVAFSQSTAGSDHNAIMKDLEENLCACLKETGAVGWAILTRKAKRGSHKGRPTIALAMQTLDWRDGETRVLVMIDGEWLVFPSKDFHDFPLHGALKAATDNVL